MNEQKRKELTDAINQKINRKNGIFGRQKQLFARKEELEQNPLIQEYNQVRDDITQIINIISHNIFTQSDEQIIKDTFSSYFRAHPHDCEHPIYIYVGSFGRKTQTYHHPEYAHGIGTIPMTIINRVSNEKYQDFSYNSYICAQCSQEIQLSDWQEFERNNTVLKSYVLKADDYVKLYLELLYYHGPEEAVRLLKERYLQDSTPHLLQFKPESQ